jgi:orotate phosphoribosyltransferase
MTALFVDWVRFDNEDKMTDQKTQYVYDKRAIARSVARMLLEIEAVLFRADEPFKLTSGMMSPVYIDCRKIISFPRMRAAMMDYGTTVIMNDIGYESLDALAGGETAGIPFAAWLAERTHLPMQYVRKKPKGFGRDARIEGDIKEGQRVLLVEDLTTDGGSKLNFVEALREAGAECAHTFVIFYYDIFTDTPARLAEAGVRLHYLSTWWDVLAECRETKRFDNKTLDAVEAFLNSPREWSKAHGGV